ncbi:MAG: divalent metal cation transporter, partial [Planctomycetota bacterium]
CFVAGPSLSGVLGGLVPKWPDESAGSDGAITTWKGLAALLATTFSVAGAFYQTYQPKQKGWKAEDARAAMVDALVGIGSLSIMTAVLVVTAASSLSGQVELSELTDAAAVARLLTTSGSYSVQLFSIGVMAAALSSFVVNALIGGVVLADVLGKPTDLNSPAVRCCTIAMLAIGMAISMTAILLDVALVRFIVIAQSLVVFAFPILAATLLWRFWTLSNERGTTPMSQPLRILIACGMAAGLLVVSTMSFLSWTT